MEDLKSAGIPSWGEDDPKFRELADRFLNNTQKKIDLMAEALNRGDFEVVCRCGHQLKGSGGSFGFSEISRIGQSLEAAGERGQAGAVGAALEQLRACLDRKGRRP